MERDVRKLSSYVASPCFGGCMLGLSLVCAYFGWALLAGYLFFFALLSGASFVWARYCALGLAVDICAESTRAYPGQDIDMACTLKNDKCLPLLWLEWVQSYPPNHCFAVPEEFQVCTVTDPATDEVVGQGLRRGFSFVKWYATCTWTTTLRAQRRGVYMPKEVEIYTGDGFGLCVRRKTYHLNTPPVLVVYPQRVGVNVGWFFKNTWNATTGAHGVIEDVTVLRTIRDYQKTDPFKRINWRLAARSGELSVNVYDTISPKTVYFLIDTASFANISQENLEFEETLSVVGSVMGELQERGLAVEVYLPGQSAQVGQEDCLLALALADCADATARFDEQMIAQLLTNQSGALYYVCYEASVSHLSRACQGLGNVAVIAYQVSGQVHDVALVSQLKKEGAS